MSNYLDDIILEYSLSSKTQKKSEIEENSIDSYTSNRILNSSYGFDQNSSFGGLLMLYKEESNNNNLEEENEIEHGVNNLYFKEKNKKEEKIKEEKTGITKITSKNSKLLSQNEQEILDTEKNASFLNKKKKRGRTEKSNSKKNKKIHDPLSKYNMSKKIRNNFLNFCILLANYLYCIFKKDDEEFEDKLFKLNNKYKINVNKKNDDSLKSKTLGQIIDYEISTKIKKVNNDNNKKIYKKIENDELLKEIFSIKYNHLFKIYYNSKRIINLSKYELDINIINKYGLNKDIILSPKIKMFKDLLENNTTIKDLLKENNIYLANKYKTKLNNCAIKNYIIGSKFLIWKDYSYD